MGLPRNSDQSADELVDFEPAGFIELDGQDRIVDANLRVQHWVGTDLERLVGKPIQWMLQEPSPDDITFAGEPLPDVYSLHALDGSVRPLQAAWGPPDPDGHRFVTLVDAERQLQHARAVAEKHAMAERTQKRLELVIQASVAFTEATSDVDLAQVLSRTATQAYAAEAAAVFVLDGNRQFVHLAGENSMPQLCSASRLLERAAALRSVLLVSGAKAAYRTAAQLGKAFEEAGVESLLVAPLQLPEEQVGILAIFFHHPRQFDDQAAPLADALAGQAARAISGLRLHRQLAHAALHDDTTGLPNRRIFENQLDAIVEQKAPLLAVLFIDLDGFKLVNDQLGHHVGDEVLRTVAARLKTTVMDCDIVARYGGDEFVVVSPISDRSAALELAQRIRIAIGAPYSMLPESIRVGASVGVSVENGEFAASQLDQLVRAADQAMYRAKSAGGDQVVMRAPLSHS